MMKDSSVMVPPLIPEIFILSNLNKDGPPDDIYLENNWILAPTIYVMQTRQLLVTDGYGSRAQWYLPTLPILTIVGKMSRYLISLPIMSEQTRSSNSTSKCIQ